MSSEDHYKVQRLEHELRSLWAENVRLTRRVEALSNLVDRHERFLVESGTAVRVEAAV